MTIQRAVPGRPRTPLSLMTKASDGGGPRDRPAAAGARGRPRRGSGTGWARFVALAEQSRSLPELLAAMTGRPLTSRLLTNQVLLVDAPLPLLMLGPGEHAIRLLEHLIVDPAHAAGTPIGMSSALLVSAGLPPEIRGPARRGEDTVTALLDRAGSYWTADTLHVEKLEPGTARPELGLDQVPALRLTRVLHLLGTPIALVVDEAPHPPPGARPP